MHQIKEFWSICDLFAWMHCTHRIPEHEEKEQRNIVGGTSESHFQPFVVSFEEEKENETKYSFSNFEDSSVGRGGRT
jgi:hypothetical protein